MDGQGIGKAFEALASFGELAGCLLGGLFLALLAALGFILSLLLV